MKQTIKYKLKPNFEQEKHLHNLCFIATKLYNTANYQRREEWDKTGNIPNYNIQDKKLKNNHWYKLLPSQTAQAVLENLDKNYKSWFSLRKTDDKANPPMYRKKEKLSVISFKQCFKIKEGRLQFSLSKKYKEENKIRLLEIEFEQWKNSEGIAKFCQIIFDKGKWFVCVVYEIPEVTPIQNNNVMAVDLGIINTASCIDTNGNADIHTGKQILAIQHYFNKERAKLTSTLTKQYPKRHKSKNLNNLARKQSKQIIHALHIHSKKIVENCRKRNMGTLAVGDVTNIRKNNDIGKKGNQKLHSWSFSKFTQQLEYKCRKVGIRFVRVNEAYTSQTCSSCGIIKKSNRKHRGLYICKCGNTINADINGARNILQKYLQENNISRSIGNVVMPLVYRIQNVVSCNVQEAHSL